jgi:hypothetical protein
MPTSAKAGEIPNDLKVAGSRCAAHAESARGRYCCKVGKAWAQQSNRKEKIFESTLRIVG